MLWVWLFLVVVGLLIASVASRVVVTRVVKLAHGTGIPPFVLGLTLLAVGTDLPEIANSIIASVSGHGDINVGDSIGSTVTQVTLVLGILPFLCGAFRVGRRHVVMTGSATVAALLAGVFVLSDGYLSNSDGLVLVSLWLVGSFVIWKFSPPASKPVVAAAGGNKGVHALVAVVGLAGVAGGAIAVVFGFVEISRMFGLPEFLITFFAGSIGTSLPELFVDVTALRRGTGDLAVGDLFGSSFVDATLSIGIGPAIAATSVTTALVVRGGLLAAAALAVVTLLFSRVGMHDRRSGFLLLLVYAATYPILLG